jgi:penicillin-binding protein 1A
VIYRHDRDAPQPQVLDTCVVHDMNFMLNKVVEEGTGRRANIEGIKAAGKTGTTNAYRDAWFVGYTGNLAAGVWFGNDDHTSTRNMTGGTLPAMTWKEVMAFAHQNLELRPLPGVDSPAGPAIAFASGNAQSAVQSTSATSGAPLLPGTLSRRSYEAIGSIGELMRRVEVKPSAPQVPNPGAQALPGGPQIAMP